MNNTLLEHTAIEQGRREGGAGGPWHSVTQGVEELEVGVGVLVSGGLAHS